MEIDAEGRIGYGREMAQLLTAHVAALGEQGLIDDAAVSLLAGVIDTVAQAGSDDNDPVEALRIIDERVNAQSPPGFVGATQVGRGTNEIVAAAVRLRVRSELLGVARNLCELRRSLIELAGQHAATIMTAYQDGQPAQPTTFGHFLGGVIGPLSRTFEQLRLAYAQINRSPLGAGALASTGLSIDRERLAELAGFDGVIPNTFDAVTAVDVFTLPAAIAESIASPVSRLLEEIRTLERTDPAALLRKEMSARARTNLPQLRSISSFEPLQTHVAAIRMSTAFLRQWSESAPFGPTISMAFPSSRLLEAMDNAARLCIDAKAFLTEKLVLNRAYLANRANRGHATIGELTDFLMLEEQIQPAQARAITDRVLAQLEEQGREASHITVEMIDAAAILVLGRELGVEFETISKYLAPRRFLERRTATGSPSPSSTRQWLAHEGMVLDGDSDWVNQCLSRLAAAGDELRSLATRGSIE
jgi:argininosuccinate lyase